jgi:hypothetical protein
MPLGHDERGGQIATGQCDEVLKGMRAVDLRPIFQLGQRLE